MEEPNIIIQAWAKVSVMTHKIYNDSFNAII